VGLRIGRSDTWLGSRWTENFLPKSVPQTHVDGGAEALNAAGSVCVSYAPFFHFRRVIFTRR
jgi:hypothetical protein